MRHRPVVALSMLVIATILALPARAQQKPFTQDQVQGMVRDGLGDETGAKAIEQRGIDFAPTEDFLHSLKAGGASEAFLQALRAAKRPGPTSGGTKKPLDQVQVITLLAGQVTSHRVAMLVQERGIDFEPTDDYLREVRLAGGEDELISALKSAKVTKPATVDPAAQARQREVRQHVARGAEYLRKGRLADAQTEYRAAIRLDPQNADLHGDLARALPLFDYAAQSAEEREAVRLDPRNPDRRLSLALTLGAMGDWDGEIAQLREALRLKAGGAHSNWDITESGWGDHNDFAVEAHDALGMALGGKGDRDGEIAEEREVLRLRPKWDPAHVRLGEALRHEGDLDGDIAEQHEALRLDPDSEDAHTELGSALQEKGDLDGAIAEYREAVRVDPNNYDTHINLGSALESKGDLDGAIAEYRDVLRLSPEPEGAHVSLGVALAKKGDLDGAVTELREALRLDPKDDDAHVNLGAALGRKGDGEAEMAQYREALRLNADNDTAHYNLGAVFELKGDSQGALQEYRAAYKLDPKNSLYREAYERTLQQVKR